MVLLTSKSVPTVTLRHKKKKYWIKVNQSDWSQDLGKFKYSGFERVGEQHREAEAPANVQPVEKPLEFRKVAQDDPYKPRSRRRRST